VEHKSKNGQKEILFLKLPKCKVPKNKQKRRKKGTPSSDFVCKPFFK